MRSVTCTIATLMLVLAPWTTAVAQAPDAYRVLFIGTSTLGASGGVHQPFEGFCRAGGLECEAVGQGWESHTVRHGIEHLGLGRISGPPGEQASDDRLHSVIESGGYDYVLLTQGVSSLLLPDWYMAERPGRRTTPYEETLAAFTRIHRIIVASGAQTVLVAKNPLRNYPNWARPLAQIVERVAADLERVEIDGERHPVLVIPHGSLWVDAVNHFGADSWFADDRHGNQLAQYASACLVFTYLTGRDPRQNPFRDLGRLWDSPEDSPIGKVSEEAAAWIKDQVWLYYTTGRWSISGHG